MLMFSLQSELNFVSGPTKLDFQVFNLSRLYLVEQSLHYDWSI